MPLDLPAGCVEMRDAHAREVNGGYVVLTYRRAVNEDGATVFTMSSEHSAGSNAEAGQICTDFLTGSRE